MEEKGGLQNLYPGYNYLGPGTRLDTNAVPVNELDRIAMHHDHWYALEQEAGVNPYTSWNRGDEVMIEAIEEKYWELMALDPLATTFAVTFLRAKAGLHRSGMIQGAGHAAQDMIVARMEADAAYRNAMAAVALPTNEMPRFVQRRKRKRNRKYRRKRKRKLPKRRRSRFGRKRSMRMLRMPRFKSIQLYAKRKGYALGAVNRDHKHTTDRIQVAENAVTNTGFVGGLMSYVEDYAKTHMIDPADGKEYTIDWGAKSNTKFKMAFKQTNIVHIRNNDNTTVDLEVYYVDYVKRCNKSVTDLVAEAYDNLAGGDLAWETYCYLTPLEGLVQLKRYIAIRKKQKFRLDPGKEIQLTYSRGWNIFNTYDWAEDITQIYHPRHTFEIFVRCQGVVSHDSVDATKIGLGNGTLDYIHRRVYSHASLNNAEIQRHSIQDNLDVFPNNPQQAMDIDPVIEAGD